MNSSLVLNRNCDHDHDHDHFMKEKKKNRRRIRRRQVFFFFFFFFFSFSIHAIVFNIYLFPCSLLFFSFPISFITNLENPISLISFRWEKEIETKTTREKVTPDTLNDTPHKRNHTKRTTKEEEKERRRREEEKEAEKRGEERKEEAGRQAGRKEDIFGDVKFPTLNHRNHPILPSFPEEEEKTFLFCFFQLQLGHAGGFSWQRSP